MSARAKSPPPRERSELAGRDEVAVQVDGWTRAKRAVQTEIRPRRIQLGDERSREEPAAARAQRACGPRRSRGAGRRMGPSEASGPDGDPPPADPISRRA